MSSLKVIKRINDKLLGFNLSNTSSCLMALSKIVILLKYKSL